MMNSATTGALVFACLTSAAQLGMRVRAALPETRSCRDADRLFALDVALFTERAAAAKWLGVPLGALMGQQ